jgi:hypothetical protein
MNTTTISVRGLDGCPLVKIVENELEISKFMEFPVVDEEVIVETNRTDGFCCDSEECDFILAAQNQRELEQTIIEKFF